MMRRCYEPSNNRFQYYGAKGVTVCERWQDFANFFEDMGERPEGCTLSRHGDQGNYEPGNVKWATVQQQRTGCKCSASLTEEQVEVIRSLHQRYAKRGCSTSNIARDLGMHINSIHRIVNGKAWSHA
jgi:hypothetical protein